MMMQFQYAESCINGAFHPEIITPEWLYKTGIIEGALLKFFDPLVEIAAFEYEDLRWEVGYDELTISTENKDVDCGLYAVKVLEKLTHVPILELIHKFQFELTELPTSSLTETMEKFVGVTEEKSKLLGELSQIGCSWVFKNDNAEIEINYLSYLSGENPLIVVQATFQRIVDKMERDRVVKLVRQFKEDQATAEKQLELLFS